MVLKRGSSDGYGVLYLQVVIPACMCYLAIVQVVCAIIHSCILYVFAAVCSPACQNGGVCTDDLVCECRAGWTGQHCSQGKG